MLAQHTNIFGTPNKSMKLSYNKKYNQLFPSLFEILWVFLYQKLKSRLRSKVLRVLKILWNTSVLFQRRLAEYFYLQTYKLLSQMAVDSESDGSQLPNLLQSNFFNAHLQKPRFDSTSRMKSREVKYIGVRVEQYIGQQVVYYKFEITESDGDDQIGKDVSRIEIERRYNHFRWLEEELKKNYIGIVIPTLPPKTLSYDVNQRKYLLTYFLQKLTKHPILIQSHASQLFISITSLSEFQAIVDKSASYQEMPGLVMNIVAQGSNLFKHYIGSLFTRSPPEVSRRIPDEIDVEFSQVSKQINKDQAAYNNVYADIELIIKNFHEQASCLKDSLSMFTLDCSTNPNYQRLKTLADQYKSAAMRFEDGYLIKLDSYKSDLNRVHQLIEQYTELKDRVHKDSQGLIYLQPTQSKALQQQIAEDSRKASILQANLSKDLQYFYELQGKALESILSSFQRDLRVFKSTVLSQKPNPL